MGRLLLPLLAAFLSLALLLAEAQAKQTPAYIALGDSLAAGVGASDPPSRGYVGLTFDALRRSDRYRERGLELFNLSVPGATSSDLLVGGGQLETALQEIARRREDAAAGDDKVEIISIDIGGNDVLGLAASGSPCLSDLTGQPCLQRFGQMLDGLRTNLTKVVRSLREAAPEGDIVIVGLYNPYSGSGAAPEVAADLVLERLNGVFRDVASDPDLHVKIAEVFDPFRGRARQWTALDGLHPNDKGHAVIAEVLLAAIQGREPVIPQEALEESPAPTPAQTPAPQQPVATSSGDSASLLLVLAIAVPAAFAAGAVISGAYLLARGRT